MKDLAHMPVPDLSLLRSSQTTWNIKISDKHPRSHERLVDTADWKISGENHFWVMKNPPVPHAIPQILVRKSLLTHLLIADYYLDQLSHGKKKIFAKDGWRSVSLQKNRYEYNADRVRKNNPGWSENMVREFMNGWFTRVREGEALLKAPPPHTTGGAIDAVHKYTSNNNLVYMGQGKNGKINYPDYYEQTESDRDLTLDEKLAQTNRRILYWVMVGSGLAPNPTEFWHFSFGDQMWAEYKAVMEGCSNTEAFYGLIIG